MQRTTRIERLLLFIGGALLILHAIKVGIDLVSGAMASPAVASHGSAYLAGYVTGEAMAGLCFLIVGIGLLALGVSRRRAVTAVCDGDA